MVTTQSFRLIGKADLKDIICDQVDGENVVFWEDIEQVFPGVKYITNGNTVISMMRDSNRKRITPQCIKHYPGVVLDVALSTTASDSPVDLPMATPCVPLTAQQPSTPAMALDLEPEMVQRLASSLTPKIQAQLKSTCDGYELIAQAIKEGHLDPSDVLRRSFQELKTEMTRNMQLSARVVELVEKKEPQDQSSDQLAMLRRQTQSVLTLNIGLHENPIPRLFVVLPLVHQPLYDPQNSSSNTFRLYFLCDCGEHTMSAKSKTSHHIHFAKHEGYDIVCPDEFFRRYGSYVLTILRMLKFGISVGGGVHTLGG
ncbi:MAG: hypothetical protein J3Q66DRAFT_339926 [Benniella sp.]|nr:MAG: hypothetical protein J3Q66DRAFT_339926 [Benniella sp.]